MRRVLVAALLPLFIGASAGAQQVSADQFPARLAPAVRVELARLADSARTMGLPVQPLIAKAAEGALKGADDARIMVAVRTLARHLGEARALLPVDASVGTLTAAASAIRVGLTHESVRNLVEANASRADADLGLALVTVTDLAASGVPARSAERAIAELMRRGQPERDLPQLRAAVARDVAAGVPADRALETRARSLGAITPPG